MKRLSAFTVVMLLGCGADHNDDDTLTRCGDSVAELLTSTVMEGGGGSNANTTVNVSAGDLLVISIATAGFQVGVPEISGVEHAIRVQGHSDEFDCDRSSTVWSVGDMSSGALSLTIASETNYTAYVMLFSGLAPDSGSVLQPLEIGRYSDAVTAAAPPVRACAGNVIISSVATCNMLTGMVSTSTFIPVAVSANASAAYFIPTESGSYGAEWTYTGGSWSANSIVFR